jgi:cell division protein FtsQ
MDGARRLLRSIGEDLAEFRASQGVSGERSREPIVPTLTVDLNQANQQRFRLWDRLKAGDRLLPRWAGFAFSSAVIIAAVGGGILTGGEYKGFAMRLGSPADIAARAAGFGISEISVSGNKELSLAEVIAATGINSANSLPFLDVTLLRDRLKSLPLVADVSVRKFYPDKIAIYLAEREPFALWQMDGDVHIVSADGTVIDEMRDGRFIRLPHVVGDGANLKVKEFSALLDSVPELRDRIRAATLVSGRRWTLKLVNGVDVKLPEINAVAALKQLVRLDQDSAVIDKDILIIDLRVPGRIAFRLREEAAQARSEIMAKKIAMKGRA